MKGRRFFILFVMATLFVLPFVVQAQAPQQINAALTDLSTRVGHPVTINDITDWSWNESLYTDTSLGCAAAAATTPPTAASIRGYQFIMTYQSVTYDYRVSQDQTIVILCGTSSSAESCEVGPGAVPFIETRLAAGTQARVVINITVSLRVEPTRGAASLADIPQETVVDVIDGPRCALGSLLYWQVRFNSASGPITGWVAEGYDGEYWLEPVNPVAGQPATRVRITAGNVATISDVLTVGSGFTATALSPDSRYLATGSSDGQLTFIDLGTGGQGFNTAVRGFPITSIVFSSDGSLVAVLSGGIIDVYNWSTGTSSSFNVTEGATVVTLNTMAFSPLRTGESPQTAGVLLLAAGSVDGRVWVWDFGNPAAPLVNGTQAHNGAVQSISFTPNGTSVITVGADGGVRVWGIGGTATGSVG
jgi:WD40 repeat protein